MENCIVNCLVPDNGSGSSLATALTTLGLLLTAVSAFIAALAYSASRRAAADGHMHSLFRDYLKLRIEREALGAQDGINMAHVDRELRSSKHYALEEMYGWLASQWPPERPSRLWLALNPQPARQRRTEALMAWKSTLAFHLQRDHIGDDLPLSADCYGRDFLEFAGLVAAEAKAEPKTSIRPKQDLQQIAKDRAWKWEPLNSWPVNRDAKPE